MKSKSQLQQSFDSTVALFTEGTILEGGLTILTKVEHLDTIIDGIDEVKEALTKISRYCRANSTPDDFHVRTNQQSPLVKNATTRSEAQPLTQKEPKRRAKKPMKAKTPERIMRSLSRRPDGATAAELAAALDEDHKNILYFLGNLMKIRKVKRRKAKKEEKDSPTTKYVFEVVE